MDDHRTSRRSLAALRDLLLISLAATALLWVGAVTNAFEGAYAWLSGRFPGQVDEILMTLATASVALTTLVIVLWRRGRRETKARVEAEGRFQALVEKMPAVTFTWDPRTPSGIGALLYVSPQVESILGFTAQEWKDDPKLWMRQIHPNDRDRVVEASERADRRGEPLRIEYRHLKKDGTVIWVREESIVVEVDARGRPSLVQGLMYDVTDRKRAEGDLAEAEARYRTLVERVPAVTYTWDAANRSGETPAPYISPQVQQLLGYSPKEFADPKLWSSLVHPDDYPRVMAEWEACQRGGVAFRSEYRMSAKDDRVVWVRDEAVPVSSDDRGNQLFQGVMFDITERKIAEDKLKAAENRYRSLVEHMPVVTYLADWTTDPPQRYVAPGIEQLLGYTPQEWMADVRIWERLLHPEDRARVLAESDRTDLSGDDFDMEYRMLAKDGRVVWVHDEAVIIERGSTGARSAWQGVFVDITSRKETEARLQEAEQTYRTLVEQLPVVVYQDAIDATSTALYLSPQYERLFGYPPEARLQDPEFWIAHLHPDDRERVLAESERTNETGEPFASEYRFLTKDGRYLWVRDEAVLLRDPEGKPLHWQGVLMDVTERRDAEESLARRDAVLEAVGFAAERFLKSAAWEESIEEVLAELGRAADASRAYVFENGSDDEGRLTMSERCEWVAPGIEPTIDEADNQDYPYTRGFSRWATALSEGIAIQVVRSEAPEAERLDMASEDILSVVAVPIFVGEEWWGYVGFDDCRTERRWSQPELDVLKAAADTLGAAIGRARAEQQRIDAETRYRTLVETMPAVIYVQGAEPGAPVTYISPQIERMLGYTPTEWGADFERWLASVHPEDRERVMEADERSDRTGEPFAVEYRQRHRDGHYLWVHDEAVLIKDEAGTPRFWQGIRFDITAQKQAEHQLREAEQRYRTLVENLPAVTYVDAVDERSSTIYVSPQVETTFGYTREEWLADPDVWTDAIHPEDRDRVLDAVRRHNELGEPFDVEYRFRARDGRWRWVKDQAAAVRDDDGRIAFSQGVMFDVTHRRLAEEKLRETEARYRVLVEHIPAVLYIDPADEHGRSLYVSPQVVDVLGVTQEEYMGDTEAWRRRIHPDDEPWVVESYRESLRRSEGWAVEYRVIRPDGKLVWIRDESVFLPSEGDRPTIVQGVLFDITERKLAEEALKQSERAERDAAERLRALDEMKNTFLAAVSHELRSPLTSILGLSLTLEQQDLPAEDNRDLLGRLASNARKLDRLLKDLLDIDRLSRGIVTPKVRPTDVGALVRRIVDSLESIGERSVLVRAEPVVVPVDPAKVERIVENLVMNAIRHTDDDVGIWVRAWPEDGGAILAIEDDGPGVPPDLQRAIFEPFRQGPTASPHSPGTGIGLSLVAMFAELHGGRAWVQDREGGGASFRVFLPGTVNKGTIGGTNGERARAVDPAPAV